MTRPPNFDVDDGQAGPPAKMHRRWLEGALAALIVVFGFLVLGLGRTTSDRVEGRIFIEVPGSDLPPDTSSVILALRRSAEGLAARGVRFWARGKAELGVACEGGDGVDLVADCRQSVERVIAQAVWSPPGAASGDLGVGERARALAALARTEPGLTGLAGAAPPAASSLAEWRRLAEGKPTPSPAGGVRALPTPRVADGMTVMPRHGEALQALGFGLCWAFMLALLVVATGSNERASARPRRAHDSMPAPDDVAAAAGATPLITTAGADAIPPTPRTGFTADPMPDGPKEARVSPEVPLGPPIEPRKITTILPPPTPVPASGPETRAEPESSAAVAIGVMATRDGAPTTARQGTAAAVAIEPTSNDPPSLVVADLDELPRTGASSMPVRRTTQMLGSPVPPRVDRMTSSVPPGSRTLIQGPSSSRYSFVTTPPPVGGVPVKPHEVGSDWKPDPKLNPGPCRALSRELFAFGVEQCLTIGVSCIPGLDAERSELAASIALALAETGHARVLLLDANFDAPVQHRLMQVEMPPERSLSRQLQSQFMGQAADHWSVLRCRKSLHLLVDGDEHTPGLILTRAFEACVRSLRAYYDFIVIDGPSGVHDPECRALDGVADGLMIACTESRRAEVPKTSQLFTSKRFFKAIRVSSPNP